MDMKMRQPLAMLLYDIKIECLFLFFSRLLSFFFFFFVHAMYDHHFIKKKREKNYSLAQRQAAMWIARKIHKNYLLDLVIDFEAYLVYMQFFLSFPSSDMSVD